MIASCLVEAGDVMRALLLVHPYRVKSFRKAVSAVMDDLNIIDSIIDNSHLINLISN